jgi:wyosine [tRNA(Phe)-imidazoG37] synthetase (radical SAM superfamily)
LWYNKNMKYIYGPVKSRRLGLSLGINLTSYKACTFDCVYCQLGQTTIKTQERKEYVDIREILDELKGWLEKNNQASSSVNFISLSGSGEPTLNLKIGELISRIKELTPVPVAVITNSSFLNQSSIRNELLSADLIVPSLDAVTQSILEKVDKPIPQVKVEEIIEGLKNLRKEYRGKIWLEVMLIKGLNDDLRHIKKMKEVIDLINPDKIQVNSPVRSTTQLNVLPVAKAKLNKIKEIFGEKCEIL